MFRSRGSAPVAPFGGLPPKLSFTSYDTGVARSRQASSLAGGVEETKQHFDAQASPGVPAIGAARMNSVSWGKDSHRSIPSEPSTPREQLPKAMSPKASPRMVLGNNFRTTSGDFVPPARNQAHSRTSSAANSRASTPSLRWPADSPRGLYMHSESRLPPQKHFVAGSTIVRYQSTNTSVAPFEPPPARGLARVFSCWRPPTYRKVLNEHDYERFVELTAWLAKPFDKANKHHQKKLEVLFEAAMFGVPYSAATENHWKKLGFQGSDPSTDFRAGGIASLDIMIYVAHHHHDVFHAALKHGRDYGFALLCINLTHRVKKHLRMAPRSTRQKGKSSYLRKPCPGRVMRHFSHAFASYTFFFHELISLCVEISHTMWLMAKGKRADLTLLQFDTVTLDRLPAAINKTFSHPVLTVAQMRARMAKHLGVRVDEFA